MNTFKVDGSTMRTHSSEFLAANQLVAALLYIFTLVNTNTPPNSIIKL